MRNLNKSTKTVRPTQKSTVRETITLASPKANVVDIKTGRDMSWLAADCFSTASAYRA